MLRSTFVTGLMHVVLVSIATSSRVSLRAFRQQAQLTLCTSSWTDKSVPAQWSKCHIYTQTRTTWFVCQGHLVKKGNSFFQKVFSGSFSCSICREPCDRLGTCPGGVLRLTLWQLRRLQPSTWIHGCDVAWKVTHFLLICYKNLVHYRKQCTKSSFVKETPEQCSGLD